MREKNNTKLERMRELIERLTEADIPAILASRDRSRAGPTLPAKGLFLKCVDYPEKEEQP